MEEEVLSECPKCHNMKLKERGDIWMQDGNIRIDYDAECGYCGYSTNYVDTLYSW